MKLMRIVGTAGVLAALSASAAAQNIVQNPDFTDTAVSSTDFPYWTVGPNGYPGIYTGLDLGPNAGGATDWITLSASVWMGDGTIYQDLVTDPGAYYLVTFWAAQTSDDTGAEVRQLAWDGTVALDFTNMFTVMGQYEEFSTVVQATSSDSVLQFQGYQNDGWWDVDYVSVEKTGAATPAPIAALPFAFGLLRRRRRDR